AAGWQGVPDQAGAHERRPQGGALHQLRLLRLRVQRDGVGSAVPRPAGAREGVPVRRRPARRPQGRAARPAERRARDLGVHPLLLLQRALPEGGRSAGRDREAGCGVGEGGNRPRHGGEARQGVRRLGGDDGLAARDGARAEDAGRRGGDQADEVRIRARAEGQSAAPVPAARGEGRARGAPPPRPRVRAGPRRLRGHRAGRAGASSAVPRRGGRRGARADLRAPRGVRAHLCRGRVAGVKRVAYYKGCLASLSAKELDSATQALAPKVGIELVELESVTCCGAGDIHEAEPDYYLHLNARILSYAAAEAVDTLMTVCNVCTLNLRQANFILKGDSDLRARVNENLVAVGVPAYERDVEVRHLLWEIAEGPGYERLKAAAHRGLKGLKVAPFYGCQILRPSKINGFEDPD